MVFNSFPLGCGKLSLEAISWGSFWPGKGHQRNAGLSAQLPTCADSGSEKRPLTAPAPAWRHLPLPPAGHLKGKGQEGRE